MKCIAVVLVAVAFLNTTAFCVAAGPRTLVGTPNFAALSVEAAVSTAVVMAGHYELDSRSLTGQLDRIIPLARGRQGANAARRAVCLMYVLGQIRAARCVPAILAAIDLSPQWPGHKKTAIFIPLGWGYHPAVQFLVRIGQPSVRAILKVLPNETNTLRRKLMVRVLVGVEGRAVTRFRLKRAIVKASTAAVKANLQAALRDMPPPAPRK